jgi:hypothetical protein
MNTLRMAAAAARFDRDLEADFARIERLIDTARADGVRLLALPEAALGGYLLNLDGAAGPPLCPDGPEIRRLARLAPARWGDGRRGRLLRGRSTSGRCKPAVQQRDLRDRRWGTGPSSQGAPAALRGCQLRCGQRLHRLRHPGGGSIRGAGGPGGRRAGRPGGTGDGAPVDGPPARPPATRLYRTRRGGCFTALWYLRWL